MGNDYAPRGNIRGDLTQSLRDVFVRKAVKAVTAHSFRIELLRDGITIRKRAVAAVKRRVEAGDLRQIRTPVEKQADRRQIVGLMERRKRDVALQTRQNLRVDRGRLAIFRAAVNDAMAHRGGARRLRLPQPNLHTIECSGQVWHLILREGLVDC
jgi:hypothetical protein